MIFIFNSFWFSYLSFKKEPYHYLRFEKDSQYYELRLAKDLLDDWTLIISNGRIKSKLGQSRIQAFSTFHEALSQFYSTAKYRHQRHYHLSQYSVEDLIYTLLLLCFMRNKVKDKIGKQKDTRKSTNTRQIADKFIDLQQICLPF